jgi:Tol biopolymer transport system component
MPLITGTGLFPRLGPNYLLYVSRTGASESIWKVENATATEIWSVPGAQILGVPAIAPDGNSVAFTVRLRGRILMYVMQADGTNQRMVADSLDFEGAPAWAPDGRSITSAADDHGVRHLYSVPVGGGSPAVLVREYSTDPAWAPGGRFLVYSGPDIAGAFSVKAAAADGAPRHLPALTLSRGARRLAFLPGGDALVFLRGDIQHKDLWRMDLNSGVEKQLTWLPADFDVQDFDVSPDGKEVVLERLEERSDVVLMDLPRP